MAARTADQIERLLDAIELIKDDQRAAAQAILRELIREDSDFEDAWMWMSLAVETFDQSAVCLDNVLRINPGNTQAISALYRLREMDMRFQRKHDRLQSVRDTAFVLMWALVIGILFAVIATYSTRYTEFLLELTRTPTP